jgi:hypothetical protein
MPKGEQARMMLAPFEGKPLWSKPGNFAYPDETFAPETSLRIPNLEKYLLHSVETTAAEGTPSRGSQPGRRSVVLVLEHADGSILFQRLEPELAGPRFRDWWHTEDPRVTYAGWPAGAWKLIARQEVALGMNHNMVRLSLGYPDKVNRTTSIAGTREQWIYERSQKDSTSYYFTNNILMSIGN